jgi:ABC-type multidrug transport system fused ATPase/permease subunit
VLLRILEARLVILDERSSHFDTETVIQTIKELTCEGKVSKLLPIYVNTIAMADEILVTDDGETKESWIQE